MNSVWLTVVSVLAVGVIAVLGVIAWRLQRRVWAQEKQQRALEAEQARKAEERTEFVLDSLRILSASVIDEDLNLSEATIRCKILIDTLNLSDSERAPYQVLDDVFERVQHFDTHGARKALSKQERRRQDVAREAIETEYEAELKACFERLRTIGLAQTA